MTVTCPNCRRRGLYQDTDERVLCLLCAYVAYDPDPDVLEKLLSNATPEAQPGIGTRITPNLDAIKSRVLAMVRQEDRR